MHSIFFTLAQGLTLLCYLDLPQKIEVYANYLGADVSKLKLKATNTQLTSNIVQYMDIFSYMRIKDFGLAIDCF
jgi:hypothetical protein